MRVNSIIATHGRPDLLIRTFESLAHVERPEGFEQFWVVENGSDAGARQVCEQWADRLPLRYHNIPEPGKSRALEWALNEIGDGFVVFFDDDVRVHPGTLTAYAAAAAEHGPRCVYGGPLEVDQEEEPPFWLRAYLPRSVTGWHPRPDDLQELTENAFLGANYAMFAEAVAEVGGFNRTIGPGAQRAGAAGNPIGQETEIQWRLFAAGYTPVLVPGAIVWHWVPRERCTPEWCVERKWRVGVRDGMLREDEDAGGGPVVAGLPPSKWKYAAQLWLANRLTALFPHAQARFAARYALAAPRGELHGRRLRWKLDREKKQA